MKYLIILGDGMADEPIASLGNKTVLQAARKPNIDKLAAMGRNGLLQTIPEGFAAGSEVAHLSILGYDVPLVYEGRGVLEAAGLGLNVAPGEMVMRCNFVCIENNRIKSHSAGQISTEESSALITFLQNELGNDRIAFQAGASYRNLLTIKGADKRLDCTPPHDVQGVVFTDVLVQAETNEAMATANLVNDLILRSQPLLENHPVNLKRAALGKNKANSIWPWSPGFNPAMKSLSELYGFKSGAVVSAVDLIKGIGMYAGLKVIEVEGATGFHTTNYEGKAQAALDALLENDFLFLHVDASDEAGHEGDVELKIKTIEYLDSRLLKPVMDGLATFGELVTIALLPDHPTPCVCKTHTSAPVPFVIYKPGEAPDAVMNFDEFSAKNGSLGCLKGNEFMKELLS